MTPMKTLRFLLFSAIITLSSCVKDVDYSGKYEGTIYTWEESNPNDVFEYWDAITITEDSWGFNIGNTGNYLDNRGKFQNDSTYEDNVFGYSFRVEEKIVVRKSKLDYERKTTSLDSTGSVVSVYFKEGVLDKQ